jgi:hypothetical protein
MKMMRAGAVAVLGFTVALAVGVAEATGPEDAQPALTDEEPDQSVLDHCIFDCEFRGLECAGRALSPERLAAGDPDEAVQGCVDYQERCVAECPAAPQDDQ